MILVIDNHDSFVHTLARYLRELGAATRVVRSDAIGVAEVAALRPQAVVLSPGPCTPDEAGVCVELVRTLGPRVPILGVCLGHQCIGQAYGGRVERALRPMHGRAGPVHHDRQGVFAGLPDPLVAARYHSLVVARDGLPPALRVTATSPEGEIMALAHARHPVVGVQFHPESVLTEAGHRLLHNFLSWAAGFVGDPT